MRFVNVFRSGNTHRITLPRSVCHGLRIKPGDTVSLDHVRDGVVELRNITYDNAQKAKGKKR